MRVTDQRVIVEHKIVTTDILCNKCGESCVPPKLRETIEQWVVKDPTAIPLDYNFMGLIEITYRGAYGSEAIPDGDEHCFSLCEPCLAQLIATFKIPSFQFSV